ncbi:hypothetical protein QE152_g38630 [Popillia japonica]|uniref:Kinetochore protein Spc24 n=1 Tax=Popillia japonica TaxID=7064 RepID=A0AAW1HWA4_POPJA
MQIEDFLQTLRSIVQNDEESTQKICEIITTRGETYTQGYLSKITSATKSKEDMVNNLCLEKIDHTMEELETVLKEVESKAAQYEKKIAKLEMQKARLLSNRKHAQYQTKLDNVKAILRCSKAIFPVEFDYSEKNITGFMHNDLTEEYRAFELPPENSASNTKYAWKYLERLFP